MKTEEGKSMEKAAEIASIDYVKKQDPHDKTDITKHDFFQGFIAGWQEREPEIERLKGLIEKAYTDSNSLQSWERFKLENNL